MLFSGFIWFYDNNHQFQTQTNNGIIYLQNYVQELSTKITGKQASSNSSSNTNQQNQSSTVNSHNDQFSGRWAKRSTNIYLDMQNSTFQEAMQEAISAWNNTGAFKFNVVNNKKNADVIATTANNSNDQAAGLTKMSENTATGYFTSGHVYLNKAYLLNPEYGYTHERIVNTAEHELGHVIGLSHNNAQSVMQPSGSFYSIQQVDIQAVNNLYNKNQKAS